MKKITLSLIFLFLVFYAGQVVAANPWRQMRKVEKAIKQPSFPERIFRITDYHNSLDTLYTTAIDKAITMCTAEGGGVVLVPKGTYKTGAIHLRSNVNLHLEEGAVLLFSIDPALYPPVLTRIEGIDCYNLSPLIYAYNEENVAITGKGLLDGQADFTNWLLPDKILHVQFPDGTTGKEKDMLNRALEEQWPLERRVFEKGYGMRPQFIHFYKCKNVLLEDFEVNRSPFWLIHPLMSENVILRGLTLRSHGWNNDGCDPESCKNVLIEDCFFNTGDDCIAIKSGKDDDGRKWMIPSENIIVRGCTMRDGHAGVAIGSEITGGCRNVWVENCQMDSPNLARIIRIKSNPNRGGEVCNVFVRNVEVGACDLAILGIELKYWNVTEGKYDPSFHNIRFENVNSKKSRYMIHVDGFEDRALAKDIFFTNCRFEGVSEPEVNILKGADNVKFKNVTINGKSY